jgi:hypothetical protein
MRRLHKFVPAGTAAAVALAWFAVLLATAFSLPIVWDEGNAILRAERVGQWGRLWPEWLSGATTENPLARGTVQWHWQYTTQVEGHPAFYGAVIALGQALAPSSLGPLMEARIGPMLLFAVAMAAMFLRLRADYSPVAGVAGVVAMATLPRLFAHAHFASFDGPLTACWVLSWAAFKPALDHVGWRIVWGVLLGMTLSCKATGWLAPIPFVVWLALYFDRRALAAVATGLGVAGLTFFVLNPPLWHDPAGGIAEFLRLNFGRGQRPELNIPILFFGHVYDLNRPLPWYNTLVWTAITAPVGTLLYAGLGVESILRRWRVDRAGVLLLGQWGVLLVVRALPLAPPHDGERLILPSFAFLAALAGVGCHALLAWRRAAPTWGRTALAGGVLVLAGSGLLNLWWYGPQWLSYYSLAIGGLRGAAALGMEPTYYWDSLDRETLAWLHANTAADEMVFFDFRDSKQNMELLVRWGVFRRGYLPHHEGTYRWYVLQNRPGQFSQTDRLLRKQFKPAFQKALRWGGWQPWWLDMPLLEVYEYADLVECRELAEQNGAADSAS